MKRRIAWLALPLVLGLMLLAVKWRADHPTATKEDLEIRALLSQASLVQVTHAPSSRNPNLSQGNRLYQDKLSRQEMKAFVDYFHLSTHPTNRQNHILGPSGVLWVDCFLPPGSKVEGTFIRLYWDAPEGTVVVGGYGSKVTQSIRPVTLKSWTKLLLDNRRIGPQLRARLKS